MRSVEPWDPKAAAHNRRYPSVTGSALVTLHPGQPATTMRRWSTRSGATREISLGACVKAGRLMPIRSPSAW
jgi:hypothetical protein